MSGSMDEQVGPEETVQERDGDKLNEIMDRFPIQAIVDQFIHTKFIYDNGTYHAEVSFKRGLIKDRSIYDIRINGKLVDIQDVEQEFNIIQCIQRFEEEMTISDD